jgi:DNA-binding NtrC family response regulator
LGLAKGPKLAIGKFAVPTPLTSSPRVLVLDPSAEGRLVLCELLGRTGVATAGAQGVGDALVTLSRNAVKVLFIDADAFEPSELAPLVEAAARRGAATVVAGTNRLVGEFGFVRKPYHYRELVHKIWAALEATENPGRAAA